MSDARILIVDDHEDNLFALESTLAPLGCRMERASSGDQALKAVLRGGLQLVLLDVVMPQVSGLDVVRYMNRLEQTQDIPVILLTGLGHDIGLAVTAHDLGVADFIVKPIDPWLLRTKVRYLLRVQERLRHLEGQLLALRSDTAAQHEHHVPEQRPRVCRPRRPEETPT
ncbi:two-component system response regulator [Streptomyces sp. NPDC059009]|uniref:response regulator n=1 Tax=Streptomyces sp. NPDC059009 TaxID=3346694 RepID=UPI003679CB3B